MAQGSIYPRTLSSGATVWDVRFRTSDGRPAQKLCEHPGPGTEGEASMHPEGTALVRLAERDVATVPVDVERLAAAWLLGHSGATRRAYATDLRHWTAWLNRLDVSPLTARRVHVDAYLRDLEREGRSPSTIARRIAALSGFYTYAMDERLLPESPTTRVRRPRVSDASAATALDRRELGALLTASVASGPRDHALACLLALDGLRVSEALGANVEALGEHRDHRTLTITRKGAAAPSYPSRPGPPRRSTPTWPAAAPGRCSPRGRADGWTGSLPSRSSAVSRARRDHEARVTPHATTRLRDSRPGCRREPARRPRRSRPRRPAHNATLRPRPPQSGSTPDVRSRSHRELRPTRAFSAAA